jgi:3-oxoacyl-[acyl-carrier-protein] synthase II
VFPYTAPNAAGGEMAVALGARGPSLALVGGPEAGLIALERARGWVARGECERAVVVAVECPPEDERIAAAVAPAGITVIECAAAVVLEASGDARLAVQWRAADAVNAGAGAVVEWGPLLSVEALARVALGARVAGCAWVVARAGAGASIEARVERATAGRSSCG